MVNIITPQKKKLKPSQDTSTSLEKLNLLTAKDTDNTESWEGDAQLKLSYIAGGNTARTDTPYNPTIPLLSVFTNYDRKESL